MSESDAITPAIGDITTHEIDSMCQKTMLKILSFVFIVLGIFSYAFFSLFGQTKEIVSMDFEYRLFLPESLKCRKNLQQFLKYRENAGNNSHFFPIPATAAGG